MELNPNSLFSLSSPKMDLGMSHGKTDAFFSLENPTGAGNRQ
jgi:hypothetical protein